MAAMALRRPPLQGFFREGFPRFLKKHPKAFRVSKLLEYNKKEKTSISLMKSRVFAGRSGEV